MGEIIPSELLSRVTYTATDNMHYQKTKQPYRRSAKKHRTRKQKSAVEKDLHRRNISVEKPRGILSLFTTWKNLEKLALRKAEINRITKERKAFEQTRYKN